MQRALGGERRGKRVAGLLERRAEPVAQNLKYMAAIGAYRALQHGAMASQGILHRIGMPLNERRRPFDIGEEKCDGAAGQGIHDASR